MGRTVCAMGCVASVALAGCGGGGGRSASTTATQPPSPFPLTVATVPTAPTRPAAPRLTLPPRRAVAQLFIVGFAGTDATTPFAERLRTRDWGGVLLQSDNLLAGAAPESAAPLVAELRAVAVQARHTPPLVVAGPGFANGVATLPATGVTMTLGPSADLGYAAGPAAGVSFGSDPVAAAAATRSVVRALQRARIVSAVGHFPGQGGASQDPDAGTATVGLDLATLRAGDERPFAAIARTAPAIQMSNAAYTAWDGVTPASLSRQAIGELRRRLGFRGVIVTGDLTAAQVVTGGRIGAVAVAALRAGADLLLIPGDGAAQDEAYGAVLHAMGSGALPRARVAQALNHVLALKRRYRSR